jgi:hypothetical protein
MHNFQKPVTKSLVKNFLLKSRWLGQLDSVSFLASGEYNSNYLVKNRTGLFVFRVNYGSQLGIDDQTGYEFRCLKLLEKTGVTPIAYFYEPRGNNFPGGVLLEEFIRGRPLDYRKDFENAAYVFSRVHDVTDIPETDSLLIQADPIKAVSDESLALLNKYPGSEFSDVYSLLMEIYEHLAVNMPPPTSVFSGESRCIVNTEVNSSNFIIGKDSAHLVDWEKAVFSYRYLDIAHFMAKTTTLWKTGYYFKEEDRINFVKSYYNKIKDRTGLTFEEVMDRTKIVEKAVFLRAMSWCYMAYYEYRQMQRPIKNIKTFNKIKEYLGGIEWFLK